MEGERRRLCRRKELGKNIPNPFHWERRDSFSTAQQSVEAREFFWLLENYRRKGYHNSELHLAGPLELDNGRREKSKISRHIGQCKKQWLLSGKRSNNMESVESESETFLRLLKKSGAIYDGEISRGELTGKLQDAFAVIIPSIDFENYPNIGLEAIACNCLVCGTDNGGIPELVASGKLLFRHDRQCQDRKIVLKLSNKRVSKILKSVKISRGSEKHNWADDSICTCLQFLYQMSDAEYASLLQEQKN